MVTTLKPFMFWLGCSSLENKSKHYTECFFLPCVRFTLHYLTDAMQKSLLSMGQSEWMAGLYRSCALFCPRKVCETPATLEGHSAARTLSRQIWNDGSLVVLCSLHYFSLWLRKRLGAGWRISCFFVRRDFCQLRLVPRDEQRCSRRSDRFAALMGWVCEVVPILHISRPAGLETIICLCASLKLNRSDMKWMTLDSGRIMLMGNCCYKMPLRHPCHVIK